MHTKLLVFGLILLMQACGQLLAQTETPPEADSPGILQRLVDRTRDATATAQALGSTAVGFLGAYYEDHVQPLYDTYLGWRFDFQNSILDRIQTTIDNYRPLKTTDKTTEQ